MTQFAVPSGLILAKFLIQFPTRETPTVNSCFLIIEYYFTD